MRRVDRSVSDIKRSVARHLSGRLDVQPSYWRRYGGLATNMLVTQSTQLISRGSRGRKTARRTSSEPALLAVRARFRARCIHARTATRTAGSNRCARVVLLWVLAIVILPLAACDQARNLALAVQRVGEDVQIVACEPITATHISVSVGDIPGRERDKVWTVEGRHSWRVGETVDLFRSPPGMTEVGAARVDVSEWSSMSIYVYGEPDGVSIYDVEDLSERDWLRWDGTVAREPCPAL